ncbi:unnamed protein product [Danaus chrysippus]|uniref:(African queen) hypothetical protein n=1 Tax=Danaus chrysippus TaxID=151541 RepID=A0A8J2R7Y1_9NEOP|nr:unnamed protein product [Danaus chrysippus]
MPAAATEDPRGMRRRVIYDPPAASPHLTSRPSPDRDKLSASRPLRVNKGDGYTENASRGVRCVMQACVLCAMWTCNDGRSFR